MIDADTILKMIESVDLSDKRDVEELDVAVWEYTKRWKVLSSYNRCITVEDDCVASGKLTLPYNDLPFYTRDRNALRKICPEGWKIYRKYYLKTEDKHLVKLAPPRICSIRYVCSPRLPTEELAELHAIIQAIRFERSN